METIWQCGKNRERKKQKKKKGKTGSKRTPPEEDIEKSGNWKY